MVLTLDESKFRLGQVVMTKGVSEAIGKKEGFSEFVERSFSNHCKGKWGKLCQEDKEMNDMAVRNGNDRILSRYSKGEWSIYIITEWDRSYTTIMFTDEY